jgi:hypothetical protein
MSELYFVGEDEMPLWQWVVGNLVGSSFSLCVICGVINSVVRKMMYFW